LESTGLTAKQARPEKCRSIWGTKPPQASRVSLSKAEDSGFCRKRWKTKEMKPAQTGTASRPKGRQKTMVPELIR